MKAKLMRVGLAVAGALVVSGVAHAQASEAVTVQATRLVPKVVARSSSGIPIEEISLSYGVRAADLDLATSAGANELTRRVNEAAETACKEIGRDYPEATPSDRECAKVAADGAMVKVRSLIAAAKKSSGK